MNQTGTLYIVSTPIGNPGDITLRALEVLKSADAVICEEARQGSATLKKLGITNKELIPLNEHNEEEQAANVLQRLYLNQNLALISDCGTPVFADPGAFLISQAVQSGIPVVPLPGASSLMAALSILDTRPNQFYFAGFLPRVTAERSKELLRLKGMRCTIILMDTPYRLGKTLEEISQTFGKGQKITLACDLTLPSETIYRGSVSNVRNRVGQRKAEFILILHS